MKVAIVHYWFITRRGGEKVVESILKLYPQADIYTLFYDKETYGNHLESHQIYTSKYDTLFFRKHYQKIFPLYPLAIKSLKLKKNYDLIISSESGPAKGIKIKNNAKHICYIHSPMRYCWGFTNEYLASINPLFRPLAKYFFEKLKQWDLTTVNNVDVYIANSNNVANRVKKYYNRESDVIYPPIDSKNFIEDYKENKKKYYLSFGAITPYKRIDLLIDCFNKNGEKLLIIGEGSEKEKLMRKAKKNIKFLGFVNDDDLVSFISNSRALLFPGEEDFGMIPLEVMSKGVPVIAYNRGGALETVLQSEKIKYSTGIFFEKQNSLSIQKAIDKYKKVEHKFDSNFIRSHAKKFEENIFLSRFENAVNRLKSKD